MQLRNIALATSLLTLAAFPLHAKPVLSPGHSAAPLAAAAADVELTMDNVTKTYMVLADIDAKMKADPAFKAKLDALGDPSKFGSDPDVSAMLDKAGISADDFGATLMTYMSAAMAAGMIKGGADKASTIAQMKTSDAAVDFVTTNSADLKALDAKYPNSMVQAP